MSKQNESIKSRETARQSIDKLTIVTIAFEEDNGLIQTFNSIEPLIEQGLRWILVIHKNLDGFRPPEGTIIIEGEDSGLYDGLNLGISEVTTDYFMLVHSGDIISDRLGLQRALDLMNYNVDVVLGGARIGERVHRSNKWTSWMLQVYVQPPHLPILYRASKCKNILYDTNISIVADFYWLRTIFLDKKVRYIHSNEIYIDMSEGGLTTSGVRSFWIVTKAFIQKDGLKALYLAPVRLMIKLILR